MARNVGLQVLRGTLANKPTLSSGEFYFATDTAQLFVGPTPTLVGPSAGSTGAQGTALLDFGVSPGKSDTSVVVTGQTGIVSGSIVNVQVAAVATADHSADEHIVEPLEVYAGNIVAGTGFTIFGINRSFSGRESPRLFGKFTIAWKWS